MHRFLATAGLLSLGMLPSLSWAETVTLTLRNGDSLHGELIERNSEDGTTVLNHPQLGRLELTAEQLRPAETKPLWTSSVSAGLIGNEKDGDSSMSISFTGKTRYIDEQQKLSLSGSFNASKSKDSGEALSIDTEKGSAELRYDKPIGSNLDLFALSSYQYNGTNDSGVNTVLGNIGVAFPLMKSETTDFTVSIGPSVQWSGGGITCPSDTFCGNTYGGATLTADLSWKPLPTLKFGLQNQFTTVWANEIQPGNTLTAEVRYYPAVNSKLFTTLRVQSIYQSMSTPQVNNTITAQVGADF
ncbi:MULTISPECIES: DUF481 domain-containing protein [unclassified Synechococcus]|uniref:DUF481 domain-containing protein n=1 Tax=unclassified Synechococcus TaxID=2626047 RepID=UPI001CF8DCC4|nr:MULTISPECIES: DUF481 domain-containing protein [unclassified Synechococcus]MCB4378080.1 DUF481 domain-containing protein [Synechococcus sp. MU1650]